MGGLIPTSSAALMLGCSVRHVQHLVTEGVLVNRSGRLKPILLDVDEVGVALDAGTTRTRSAL